MKKVFYIIVLLISIVQYKVSYADSIFVDNRGAYPYEAEPYEGEFGFPDQCDYPPGDAGPGKGYFSPSSSGMVSYFYWVIPSSTPNSDYDNNVHMDVVLKEVGTIGSFYMYDSSTNPTTTYEDDILYKGNVETPFYVTSGLHYLINFNDNDYPEYRENNHQDMFKSATDTPCDRYPIVLMSDYSLESVATSVSLSLVYPPDSSSVADFTHWQVGGVANYNLSGTPGVLYGNASSVGTEYFDTDFTGRSMVEDVYWNEHIRKTTTLYGHYKAKAVVYDLDYNIVASSSWSYFDVDAFYTQFTGPTSSIYESGYLEDVASEYAIPAMNSSSPFYVDCSEYSGVSFITGNILDGLGCWGEKISFVLIQALLVPPTSTLVGMERSYNTLKTVYPFLYFYQSELELEDMIKNHESYDDIYQRSVNLTVMMGGVSSTYVVYNSSTIMNAFGGGDLYGSFYDWWNNFLLMIFDVGVLATMAITMYVLIF